MPATSLDDIMSDREAAPEAQNEPAITDADRAANPIGAAKAERDRQGRFAPKSDQQADTQQDDGAQAPEGQQRQTGTVPKQALDATRHKLRERDDELNALRQQMAELQALQIRGMQPRAQPEPQQPAKPPEWWEDPAAATDYRVKGAIDPVRQELESFKITMSRNFAEQQHGKEAVDAAIGELGNLRQSNPAEYQRLEAMAGKSMDPVGDVVRWHKQFSAMSEVGTDLAAYKAKLRAEWEAEQAAGQGEDYQPAPQRQPPPQRLPTSFASEKSGGARGGNGYGGPRALSDIMPRG